MNVVCRSHALRDYKLQGWHDHIAGRWSYRQLAADPNWREGWISFDALTWDQSDGHVYCGLNAIDGDLLYRFDPRSSRFESLNARAWADPFDVKIHRTLLRNPADGCFYFGTSLLHDADRQHEAPGGKLVKYDPRAGRYETLAIPFPHLYLQSVAADFERGILYAFTYPAEFLVRYDMNTQRCRTLAYLGNAIMFAQPHNAVVDRSGCLWGTYAETRAWDERIGPCPIRLFKYEPDADRFTWFEHGLSRRSDRAQLLPDPPQRYQTPAELTETRHKEDYGFCDSMAYDGGRYIYAGTVAGVLCRIDVATAEVTKVAHVMPAGRFPALLVDAHGVVFGAGGMRGETQVVRWDPRATTIDDAGPIIDPATGERPARIHDIAVDGEGQIFLAENDNHARSSYLWTLTYAH